MTNDSISRTIEVIARHEGGRLLAALVGQFRNFQLAEDSLQDALESALVHWNRNGLPNSPFAWLIQAARRKAIDRLRKAATRELKADELAHLIELENRPYEAEDAEHFGDERLKLIFTCCHPALERKTAVALTLRSICGLTTEEIADAFVDTRETMAQRLVRARRKISVAGIAYEVPSPERLSERLETVLQVIYLIFNEGYASSGTNLIRADLTTEAIRLAEVLDRLMPEIPETEGLLALMMLVRAREKARLVNGEFVPLEQQERALWDRSAIESAIRLLDRAVTRGRPGPYQLQAAIAALHSEAASFESTEWHQIVLLYRELVRLRPNPVAELNLAVAVSYATDAQAGLDTLTHLAEDLERYRPFHAARADMLMRLGRKAEAVEAYERAIELCENETERKFLERRMSSLSVPAS